jgi:uncharacterized membrane protein
VLTLITYPAKLKGKYSRVMGDTTDLFGIPVPSTDRTFLIIVVIHILLSLVALISGLFAMLSDKGSFKHSKYGKAYFFSMLSAFGTVLILSIMSWPRNTHLLLIGMFAAIFTYTGSWLAKMKPMYWQRLHTVCMGGSYILLLTGFYVDNGKNLPFWNQFSQTFFYLFPASIGIPIILYTLMKHPLNKA